MEFEKGVNGPTVAEKNFLVVDKISNFNTQNKVQSFIDAFKSCKTLQINQVTYTFEGDPILNTMTIEKDGIGCYIKLLEDSKYDRFGPHEIHVDRCLNAEIIKKGWKISQCQNGEYYISFEQQEWSQSQNLFDK